MSKIFREAPPLSQEDERLVEAYEQIGRTLDDLFYTEDFERLCRTVQAAGDRRSDREIAQRLLNLRKAARLPRLGGAAGPTVDIDGREGEILADLVPRYAGTLGQRDKLIYSAEFEQLAREFNRHTRRNLDFHDVWRLVARIAK